MANKHSDKNDAFDNLDNYIIFIPGKGNNNEKSAWRSGTARVVNVQSKLASLGVNQWEQMYLGYLRAIFGGRE